MDKEKKTTLEDFVRRYIENKAIAETKKGYAEWLISNGSGGQHTYSDKISEINAGYARANTGYGKNAETLAGLGLSVSGYSDYLRGAAYKRKIEATKDAKGELIKAYEGDAEGYSNYLIEYNASQEKRKNSVIRDLIKLNATSYDEAYKYAMENGLDKDFAADAADNATKKVIARLRETVINAIVNESLSSKEAYDYAIKLGLSSEDAKDLSNYASGKNEIVPKEEPNFIYDIKKRARDLLEKRKKKK